MLVLAAILFFAGFVAVMLVSINFTDPCIGNGKCVTANDTGGASDRHELAQICGNDICDDGENPANCALDCEEVCGDGACGFRETFQNCPSDCPVPDCGSVCREKGCLYALSECSSVNILSKFNISTRVTCCCANENRVNTCGNGVCQKNQQEDEFNCPVDCKASDNSCAGENEAISGRTCCPGLAVKCGEVPMTLPNGTTKMSPTGCWCIPEAAVAVCGDGICQGGEDGYDCPQDCPRISRGFDGSSFGGCASESDCGACQSCNGGQCVDISTDWGAGLYGCPAGFNPDLKRCYKGECTSCSGEVIYDTAAKRYGCWYLADPATGCEDFCSQKGCAADPAYSWHWGDDENCTIGKKMTGCGKCSLDYENGWWVPYYDIAKDTCYYYQGVGVSYSCYWGPEMANIRRICACNY